MQQQKVKWPLVLDETVYEHNNVCQLWAEVPGFTLWTVSADVQQIKVLFVVVMAGNVLHHVGRHEHITITTGRELYTPLN